MKRPETLAKLLRTLSWSRQVYDHYRGQKISCVNAHSLAVLPLAARLARTSDARLIYDTHELETEVKGSTGVRRWLGRIVERRNIHKCDAVFVVSPSIAEWYSRTYDLAPPTVVRNIPESPAANGTVAAVSLREQLQIPAGAVVFIYQGGLIPGRGVERMLQVFEQAPSAHLVCMGSGTLLPYVREFAKRHPHIHVLPPVRPDEVLGITRQANVGICLTDDSCLSHRFSLPNKLFEYLHAGIPVIVNPLPEQENIVRTFGCGWIAPAQDNDLAALLAGLNHDAIAAKTRNVAQAAAAFTWDAEKQALLAAYGDLRFD